KAHRAGTRNSRNQDSKSRWNGFTAVHADGRVRRSISFWILVERASDSKQVRAAVRIEPAGHFAFKHSYENLDRDRCGCFEQMPAEGSKLSVSQNDMAMSNRLAFEPRHVANQRHKLH